MIPTAHKYIEQLSTLTGQTQQQIDAIKSASHCLGIIAKKKERLFTSYLAEVNTSLQTQGLEIIFDIHQVQTPDQQHDPAPQYFLHIVLDGHIHHSVEYAGLYGAKTHIAALSDFISSCKTIYTMDYINNLDKGSPWVCFMSELKQE